MKICPKCNKKYNDYDQYCIVCRYKLKYIEGTERVDYVPEPMGKGVTEKTNNKPTVACPYCKSTNTKKISATSKAVHTAFFGIFSISRNSKQWHCNDCNSDF